GLAGVGRGPAGRAVGPRRVRGHRPLAGDGPGEARPLAAPVDGRGGRARGVSCELSSYTSLKVFSRLAALGQPWETCPMVRNRGSWLLVLAACVGGVASSGRFAWGQPAADRGRVSAAASPPAAVAAGQAAVEPLRTPSD